MDQELEKQMLRMEHSASALLGRKHTQLFGFWSSKTEKHLPTVAAGNYDNTDIVRALAQVNPAFVSYRGSSTCRICGCLNGSRTNVLQVGTDVYAWPEGLTHYLQAHGVKPPEELVEMLANRRHMHQTLSESGYMTLREIHGAVVGIHKFFVTTGVVIRLEPAGYERRYCYEHAQDALDALASMTSLDEHLKGPWIKCKGTFRGQYIDALNPIYTKG